MKTIKLILALLLLTAVSTNYAFSSTSEQKETTERKQINKIIKQKLNRNGFTDYLIKQEEYLYVRFKINKNNYIEVEKIFGENSDLNERVKKILERKPLKASPDIIGESFVVKIYLKKEA